MTAKTNVFTIVGAQRDYETKAEALVATQFPQSEDSLQGRLCGKDGAWPYKADCFDEAMASLSNVKHVESNTKNKHHDMM
jgi:hypothetical protein